MEIASTKRAVEIFIIGFKDTLTRIEKLLYFANNSAMIRMNVASHAEDNKLFGSASQSQIVGWLIS
jgi:hypothetical protein